MENYDKAMEYADAAAESSGSGMEKFQAYQESVAGSLENFKNSYQQLSSTIISSDFMTGIIDSGSQVLNIINQIIDSVGNLNTLVLGFSMFQGAKSSG